MGRMLCGEELHFNVKVMIKKFSGYSATLQVRVDKGHTGLPEAECD